MQIYPWRHLDRVYCAGPLFNAAERQEMEDIAEVLSAEGFTPFVPHRDGLEFALVLPFLVAQGYDQAATGQLLHEAVFALDAYHVIEGCGLLVCNLNGRVPDEGAVAETAMAWTLGKPIVMFKEDCRSKVAGRDNPLVVGMASFETVKSMQDLPAALKQKRDDARLDADRPHACPPHLEVVLERGGTMWRQLQELGTERPNAEVARIIQTLFDPDSTRLARPCPVA